MSVLTYMPRWEGETFPQLRKYWRGTLFAWGFPTWFAEEVTRFSCDWTRIIPDLYSGNFGRDRMDSYPRPVYTDAALRTLTEIALTEGQSNPDVQKLRLSLQLDGFELGPDGHLRRIGGPVSVEEEKSRLLEHLRKSRLGRQAVIRKHIEDAEDHFTGGKPHSAIGEARSALQAVIEETVKIMEGRHGKRAGGSTKDRIRFLTQQGFLSSDEETAFLAAWGFLSSGNHPGMPLEEDGRIGTIFALEFIQILLVKGENLL